MLYENHVDMNVHCLSLLIVFYGIMFTLACYHGWGVQQAILTPGRITRGILHVPLKQRYVRKSSVFGLTGNNFTGVAFSLGLVGVSTDVEGLEPPAANFLCAWIFFLKSSHQTMITYLLLW